MVFVRENKFKKNVGNFLKHERMKKKISAKKMAEMLGTNAPSICLLEKGKTKLSLNMLIKWLICLDLNVCNLFIYKENGLHNVGFLAEKFDEEEADIFSTKD